MRKFKEFKEGIVDMFIDMREEDDDADYMVDWIMKLSHQNVLQIIENILS